MLVGVKGKANTSMLQFHELVSKGGERGVEMASLAKRTCLKFILVEFVHVLEYSSKHLQCRNFTVHVLLVLDPSPSACLGRH